MKLLLIKDDKPGHYNQSYGIIKAFEHLYENVEVEVLEVQIKSKFKRELLKVILNLNHLWLRLKNMGYFYKNFEAPKQLPDIIISSGGNTSFLNAYLKQHYKCKNIFNGSLRNLNHKLFDIVFSVNPLGCKNNIVLNLPPNTIVSDEIIQKGKAFLEEHHITKSCYSIIIGGEGSGYSFSAKDIILLLSKVTELAKQEDKCVLVTTSRRTGELLDNIVAEFESEYIGYKVIWSQNPQKVMGAFLGASEKIFVTEESSSMLSEAIASKKEVYSMYPSDIKENKKYKMIIDTFESKKLITRCKIGENIPKVVDQIDIQDSYLEIAQNLKKSILLEGLES